MKRRNHFEERGLGYFQSGGRWTLLAAVALAWMNSVPAQPWFVDGRLELRGAVVPIYLGSGSEPAAIVRCDHILTDYQRRGFFRIGALPLLVIDGLNIEIRDPARLSAALVAVSRHFSVKDHTWKGVEGREFTLSLGADKDGQLRARRVRLENGTAWQLQEGSIDRSGSAAIAFRRATLIVAGFHAGELACETANGAVQLPILSLLSKKYP